MWLTPLILARAVLVYVFARFSYMDIFGLDRFAAMRRLPVVVKSLGFKEKPGSSSRSFNEYSGKYKGHFVKIKPEGAEITVFMRHIPNLKLSTFTNPLIYLFNFDTILVSTPSFQKHFPSSIRSGCRAPLEAPPNAAASPPRQEK